MDSLFEDIKTTLSDIEDLKWKLYKFPENFDSELPDLTEGFTHFKFCTKEDILSYYKNNYVLKFNIIESSIYSINRDHIGSDGVCFSCNQFSPYIFISYSDEADICLECMPTDTFEDKSNILNTWKAQFPDRYIKPSNYRVIQAICDTCGKILGTTEEKWWYSPFKEIDICSACAASENNCIRQFELEYQEADIKDWAEFGSLTDNIPIYFLNDDEDNNEEIGEEEKYVYILYNINKDSKFYHSVHVLLNHNIYKIDKSLEDFILGLQITQCSPIDYIRSYFHCET